MKLSDFKGLFKKSITIVESVENTFEDYYVIKLIAKPGFAWSPGEHGIFTLPGKVIDGRKWRAFSVASIPEEGFVLLGTRTGIKISSFKKELIALKKGDKVAMRGPFGWFKLQDNTSPLVMFAGGVGITPIRALLKALESDKNRTVEVVYSSNKFYMFDEEIEEIIKINPRIILHKTVNTEETKQKIDELAKKYGNKAYYYNSGSFKVVKSIKTQLKGKGVKGKRLIDDWFFGY